MKRMIWLVVGCVMGFVFGRTMAGDGLVNTNAVGFVVLVLLVIAFGMGRRNKAEASAMAAANAVAVATVEFEAQLASTATALAQNAVTIHLQNAGIDADAEALVHSAAAQIEAEKRIETSIVTNTQEESVGYM